MNDTIRRFRNDSHLNDQTAAPNIGAKSGEKEAKPDATNAANAIESTPTISARRKAADQSRTGVPDLAFETKEAASGSDEITQSEANRPRFSERPADVALLTDQLLFATRLHVELTDEKAGLLLDGSVGFYQSFNPRDAKESALARLIVAVTNASMDSFGLAAGQSDRAREQHLRLAFKGAETAKGLIEMFDSLRRRAPQNVLVGTVNNVTVGEVNVEKGAQAIVGTIEGGPQKKSAELTPPSRLRNGDDQN